jgi:hypothetical protein
MRAQTCRTHFGIGFSPGYRRPGVASILRTGVQLDFCPETKDLSRRDYRTQPGVLTPGTDIKDVRPEIGGREVSALDAERDPNRFSAAPSASPTRYAGAIRTWRRTPTLRSTPTPPFEDEHEDDF